MASPCMCGTMAHNALESSLGNDALNSQLANAQRMEDIHILTGGICHHFNNQLATILGYLELVKQCDKSNPNSPVNDYLDKVNVAAEQMKDLVAQLRHFCAKQGEKSQPVCLVEMLYQAQSSIRASVESDITLHFELSGDCHDNTITNCTQACQTGCLIVNADMLQLQQMLMILVNNAVNAIEDKGEISIGVSKITIEDAICDGCHQPFDGEYAQLWVLDNGEGIEASIRDKLFMPFFTTRQMEGGTGMGLSVVHGMLHEHQGHILFNTKPGIGSCFKLLFPLANQSSKTKSNPKGKEECA